MNTATIYRIVIRGRASTRLLRPLLDDFTVDFTIASVEDIERGDVSGTTCLTGEIRDSAQLHGVLTHLTAVGAELVSLTPCDRAPSATPTAPTTPPSPTPSSTSTTPPTRTTQMETSA